jgi:hypothetical protein
MQLGRRRGAGHCGDVLQIAQGANAACLFDFSMYWWVACADLSWSKIQGRSSRSSAGIALGRPAFDGQQQAPDTRVLRCTHRSRRVGPRGSMRPQTRGDEQGCLRGCVVVCRYRTDIVGRSPALAGTTATAPAEAGRESRTTSGLLLAPRRPANARDHRAQPSSPSAIALLFWAQWLPARTHWRTPSPCAPSHPEIHDPWGAHRLRPPSFIIVPLSSPLHRLCALAR